MKSLEPYNKKVGELMCGTVYNNFGVWFLLCSWALIHGFMPRDVSAPSLKTWYMSFSTIIHITA